MCVPLQRVLWRPPASACDRFWSLTSTSKKRVESSNDAHNRKNECTHPCRRRKSSRIWYDDDRSACNKMFHSLQRKCNGESWFPLSRLFNKLTMLLGISLLVYMHAMRVIIVRWGLNRWWRSTLTVSICYQWPLISFVHEILIIYSIRGEFGTCLAYLEDYWWLRGLVSRWCRSL